VARLLGEQSTTPGTRSVGGGPLRGTKSRYDEVTETCLDFRTQLVTYNLTMLYHLHSFTTSI
jgi:hypothetical protein